MIVRIALLLTLLACVAVFAALRAGAGRNNALLAYVEMYGQTAQARVVDVDHGRDRRVLNYTDCQVGWMPGGNALLLTQTLPAIPHQVVTVPLAGGEPDVLTGGGLHNEAPSLSPDGAWIVYAANRSNVNTLYLLPTAGGRPAPLAEVPLWVYRTRWMADDTIEVVGIEDNQRLARYRVDVASGGILREARLDEAVSASGRFRAYRFASDEGALQMLRVEDTAGRLAREVVVGPTPILPVWSPVTDHLAYVVSGADAQGVWLLDMAGGEPRPLASGYREVGAMAWSGNGERLAFSAQSRVVGQRLDRLAPHNLYTVQADGNGLAVARRGFGAYVNNFSRFCALAWG